MPNVSTEEVDYTRLFDYAPVGYLVIGDESRVVAANVAAASMLGVDRDELQNGRFFSDFLHEDGVAVWKDHRKCVVEQGKKHSADLLLKRPDHSVFSVRVECVPQVKLGSEVCCLMVMVDISDRVAALQASEEKYRHLVEHTSDVPCKLNSKGLIVYVGPQIARFGFDPKEVLNTNFVVYIHPDDQERVSADFAYAVAENASISSEFRVIAPGGTVIWFEHRSVLFVDGPDGVPELNIILRDITERKAIEAAREWTDHQRRIALDAAHLGWWHIDLQTQTPTFDERQREIFGITQEDLRSGELLDRVHPEDRERVVAQMKAVLDSANPQSCGVEYRIIRPDGEIRWVEAFGMKVYDGVGSDRHAVSIVGTVADITEQKQMREALEKRVLVLTQPLENKEIIAFEDLVDLGQIQKIQDEFAAAVGVASVITRPDGVLITRPSNDSIFCEKIRSTDQGFCDCMRSAAGIGEGDPQVAEIRTCFAAGLWNAGACILVGGRRIANWLIGQVRNEAQSEDRIRAYARELKMDEEALVEAFYRIPEMSKERFEIVAKALHTMANQISTAAYQNILQARFITAQEKTKNELRDSEERYRGLFETVSDAIIVFDGESRRFVDVNDAALKLYGYSHKDLFKLSRDALSTESDAAENVKEEDEESNPVLHCFHRKSDGRVIPVEVSQCSFSRGDRVLVCELVRDISGRMAREQEIQTSREELRRLASELSLAEQRERQCVADALHDGLGQLLSSAYLRVGALSQNKDLPEGVREPMEAVGQLIGQSLAETRSLTFDLSCPALNELGLAAALKELCRTMSTGFGIVFEFCGELCRVPLLMDHKIVLYRAVRELLMNVIRHSGARKATVSFDCADEKLQILVKDNGKGFDDTKAGRGFSPSGGYGLFSIRESVRHVGGSMLVTSVPKSGTCVQITTPLRTK
ncbi:MAG: PAS domain S-box protein [Pontiellaceae bacterium]|nr:PAS domain S-box protein [Pontiellaceae bacterium]